MLRFNMVPSDIILYYYFLGLWLYDIPHYYRPINMQNNLTSLMYLMQDYDCITPGTVPYFTVLHQKMAPYGTVPVRYEILFLLYF
jgi:hypothetical protein